VNRTLGIRPRLAAIAAVAAASAMLGASAASAAQPVGPGGCNMLTPDFTQSPVGTGPMMAGASDIGAYNMVYTTLLKFEPPGVDPGVDFCGAYDN
jgi:opacity protein-like surface antigen